MANLTARQNTNGVGQEGRRFHLFVKAGVTVYEGAMVAQDVALGGLVHASVAGSGPVIGIATHQAAAGERCLIETDRIYLRENGTAGDAFSDASMIGAPCYAFDDHTVYDNDASGTLQFAGIFMGMEADGRVRVKISADLAAGRGLTVQRGSGTFAAGVLTVNAGITVTATSVVIANRKTEAGTDGDEIRVPTADRTVGGPGTGALTFRSFLSGVAATSDTSTFDYVIVG